MKRASRVAAAVVALLALPAPRAHAQAVPQTIDFTARLEDAGGPLTGAHDVELSIWNADSGGTMVWNESRPSVLVDAGLLDVELGAITGFNGALDGSPRWLEVMVDGITLSPRTHLVSVPWALRAGDAERLGGNLPSVFLHVGEILICNPGQHVIGLQPTGNVLCATDPLPITYGAGTGLQLVGNLFSIAVGGVTTAMLANGAVTSAKIADGSIVDADIQAINGNKILPNTLGSAQITNGSILGGDLSPGCITSNEIFDGSIDSGDLHDDSVVAATIAAGAVGTSELAAGAVTSTKLAADSVGMRELATPMGMGRSAGTNFAGQAPAYVVQYNTSVTPAAAGNCLVTVTSDVDISGSVAVTTRVGYADNGAAGHIQDSNFTDVSSGGSSLVTVSAVVPVQAGHTYQFGCESRFTGTASVWTCAATYLCQ